MRTRQSFFSDFVAAESFCSQRVTIVLRRLHRGTVAWAMSGCIHVLVFMHEQLYLVEVYLLQPGPRKCTVLGEGTEHSHFIPFKLIVPLRCVSSTVLLLAFHLGFGPQMVFACIYTLPVNIMFALQHTILCGNCLALYFGVSHELLRCLLQHA